GTLAKNGDESAAPAPIMERAAASADPPNCSFLRMLERFRSVVERISLISIIGTIEKFSAGPIWLFVRESWLLWRCFPPRSVAKPWRWTPAKWSSENRLDWLFLPLTWGMFWLLPAATSGSHN